MYDKEGRIGFRSSSRSLLRLSEGLTQKICLYINDLDFGDEGDVRMGRVLARHKNIEEHSIKLNLSYLLFLIAESTICTVLRIGGAACSRIKLLSIECSPAMSEASCASIATSCPDLCALKLSNVNRGSVAWEPFIKALAGNFSHLTEVNAVLLRLVQLVASCCASSVNMICGLFLCMAFAVCVLCIASFGFQCPADLACCVCDFVCCICVARLIVSCPFL